MRSPRVLPDRRLGPQTRESILVRTLTLPYKDLTTRFSGGAITQISIVGEDGEGDNSNTPVFFFPEER